MITSCVWTLRGAHGYKRKYAGVLLPPELAPTTQFRLGSLEQKRKARLTLTHEENSGPTGAISNHANNTCERDGNAPVYGIWFMEINKTLCSETVFVYGLGKWADLFLITCHSSQVH